MTPCANGPCCLAEPMPRQTSETPGSGMERIGPRADTGPSSRSKHAMAFDKDRAQTVLFSGSSRNSAPVLDTWGWDGADWTQIEDTGPPPRTSHVLGYDTNRKRMVLFGGSSPSDPVGDTWE